MNQDGDNRTKTGVGESLYDIMGVGADGRGLGWSQKNLKVNTSMKQKQEEKVEIVIKDSGTS